MEIDIKKMNDFIYSALSTLRFVEECKDPENAKKTIEQVIKEWEKDKAGSVLNPATYVLMAYPLFVMIHEIEKRRYPMLDYSTLKSIDERIDERFEIKEWDNEEDNIKNANDIKTIAIIRRIRNAISHIRFDYSNDEKGIFTFVDVDDKYPDTTFFKAEISLKNFRDLLTDLGNAWNTQQRKNKKTP